MSYFSHAIKCDKSIFIVFINCVNDWTCTNVVYMLNLTFLRKILKYFKKKKKHNLKREYNLQFYIIPLGTIIPLCMTIGEIQINDPTFTI